MLTHTHEREREREREREPEGENRAGIQLHSWQHKINVFKQKIPKYAPPFPDQDAYLNGRLLYSQMYSKLSSLTLNNN